MVLGCLLGCVRLQKIEHKPESVRGVMSESAQQILPKERGVGGAALWATWGVKNKKKAKKIHLCKAYST